MLGKLQFGVYELDRDAMELRKHGVTIRLQEQPLRVLATLMERPGEIVTREELQERIWGKDTFVDFEQSLNKAVNRVREALNDEAGQPRYVETVPRRGYRFIAPVTVLNSTEQPRPPVLPDLVSDAKPVSPGPRRGRTATIAVLAIAGLLVAVGIVAVLFRNRPEKSASADPKRITTASGCCETLSRDGKLLAYASGISGGVLHIWVQQTDGGEPIQVTNGSDRDFMPDFSPDGTHIAFGSIRDGGGIFIVPALSGEPKRLTTSGDEPIYFPDGQQILYLDGTDRDTDAIVVSADSGKRTPLRLNQNFLVHGPAFLSPDGDQVIFYGVRKQESNKPDEAWIAPVTASDAMMLRLPGTEEDQARELVRAWVRGKDGRQWILYSSSSGEIWRVLRVGISLQSQIDGRPEQLISGTGHLGHGFSVSQDGKLIYTLLSSTNSIYEIPIGSRGEKDGPTLQLPLPEGDFSSPSVSRDGKWMVYDSSGLGKSNAIRLRDLASGADRVLDEMGRKPGTRWEASISPDGSKVIFERDCNTSKWETGDSLPCGFMVSAAGGEPEQICEFCTPRGFSSDGSTVLIQ